MTACSNCGRVLPEGAFFCPDCGVRATAASVAPSNTSPSHFNYGMTASSEPQGPALYVPPWAPDEKKRSSFSGRRGLVLVVIGVLAVLLVGTTFESGMLGAGGAPAVNSASTPFTGGQLYEAYAANDAQATAAYTNKTVYIQDSLDFGVATDFSTGQYYSSVDSGNVILFWSSNSQLGQLSAGATVLARCSVGGEQSQGAGYLLVLEGCSLVSVQSQSPGTTKASVSVNNE